MKPALEMWLDVDACPIRLRCRGQLDSGTVRRLQAAVEELLASRPNTLVLECAELGVIDVPGERCLASIESAARRSGVTVIWSGVDRGSLPHVLGALGVTVLTSTAARLSVSVGAWSRSALTVDDLVGPDEVKVPA